MSALINLFGLSRIDAAIESVRYPSWMFQVTESELLVACDWIKEQGGGIAGEGEGAVLRERLNRWTKILRVNLPFQPVIFAERLGKPREVYPAFLLADLSLLGDFFDYPWQKRFENYRLDQIIADFHGS